MATPVVNGSGAVSESTGTTVAPAFPATINADDLLVLSYTATTTTAPDTPAGWTLASSGSNATGNGVVTYVWTKVAAGTETGSETITKNASVICLARIWRVTGGNTIEAAVNSSGSGTPVAHPAVTTTGVNQLVLAFTGVNDDETAASFTGETGGDLTLTAADTTATSTDMTLSIQEANLATAATITGGTWSFGGAPEQWATVAFSVIEDAVFAGTLVLDGATYAYSGTLLDFSFGKTVTLDAAANYPFTGAALSFNYGKTVALDGATYSYTAGAALGLALGKTVTLDGATYAYPGAVVGMAFGRSLVLTGTTYAYSGAAMTFVASALNLVVEKLSTVTFTRLSLLLREDGTAKLLEDDSGRIILE